MTTRSLHRITCLLCLLAGGLSLYSQQWRIDYDGDDTPPFEVSFYPADILREGYTEHASVSFACCFALQSSGEDNVTDLTFSYAKGEKSDFLFPIVCVDSVNVRNVTPNELDAAVFKRNYPGYFFYPYLKLDCAPGIYRDTLVIQGQWHGHTLTFNFFFEQRVARFHEVYIDKGETYSFEGEQLSVSGRYISNTDVLDLIVVEPCEVHIEASETFLREPGTVQLNADRAGDYYEWTGYGLDDLAIRNPKATIDTDGEKEYTMELTAFTETGPNLAPNGNFEGGYTGFETDYSAISNPLFFIYFKGYEHVYIKGAGHYSLVAYPNQVNGPWPLCRYDGYMMVIDGHYIANNRVYASYVNVEPHTWYAFSVDVASVSNIVTNQPKLQFYINDQTLGDSHVPNTTACDWKKLYTIWYSGETAGSIPIILRNTQTASGGNDFAIDNLSFRKLCRATDRLTITADFTPCEDVTVTSDFTACDSYVWHGKEYTVSGKYTWETKTVLGCDSTEILDLTIAHPQYVSLTDTACVSYTWHGQTYTESGEYTYETKTTLGCDSTEHLTLTIAPSYNIPDTAVACERYDWQGETYTVSGNYRRDFKTVFGCDSVHTLNLTIHHNSTGEEQMVEYKEYLWKGQTYTASGDYSFDTLTTHGCDSLVTLRLTIVDTPFVAALLPVADLCADDRHVAVEYTLADVILPPQRIDIIIDHPKFATFHTDELSGTALITLPDSIRPDWYSGLFRISYKSYVQEMPFTFLVRYPSTVIGQKWNNVLALKNSRYNGGWLWDAYRWYVDGREMPGETQSFIYCGVGNILLMGHPYHASLRRVGEDYFIPTCPIIPVPHEDVQPIPTLLYPGQRIAVRRDGQNIPVTIYDLSGRVLVSGTDIEAPSVQGVYMMESDGEIQKMIVR